MNAFTSSDRVAAPAARLRPAATLPSQLPLRRRMLAFAVMCIGYFIAYLDIQIVSSSLQEIGGGLSASQDEIAWVQTSYLIAEIIVIPLSGWLSRVLSTRWLFTISAAGFTVTSLLCGWAWDIQSMIVFRALQGFLGGSMIPMVFTSAFAFFEGRQRPIAAAIVASVAYLAPTLGPVIGGWITDTWSWHWLFFINLAPGIAVTILVPLLVDIDRPDLTLLKGADYPGMVLMAMFLGCLEYALEEGPRYDWLGDETIRACVWISAVAGIAFIWRTLSVGRPILDLRALRSRNFALGCWFSFVTGIGIFCTVLLTPEFLNRVRGFDAWQNGTALLSNGIFGLLAVPFYVVLARRIDLRWLMMFGLALFAASLWAFEPITHDWGWRELLLPQALRGIAQPFCVAPAVTLTLGDLPPERLKLASGLFNVMRNLGGAIGIAGCGTILNDRTNLHFLRIAEHLTPANAAMVDLLQRVGARYAQVLGDAAHGQAAALKQLWLLCYREALVQTFADAYLAIAVCFVVAAAMVPLMRKVAAPKAPPQDAH